MEGMRCCVTVHGNESLRGGVKCEMRSVNWVALCFCLLKCMGLGMGDPHQ